MKKLLVIIGIALCALVVAQAVQRTYRLIINAKSQNTPAIVVGGKTYVPLDALRASGAGVSLSGSTLTLTLPGRPVAQGEANQNAAVEGCLNEWLFNGLWRFRVTGVQPSSDPQGWKATVEVRNGSRADGLALAGTGWGGMRIILSDGNPVEVLSDAVDVRDQSFLQGAGKTITLAFPSEETSKTPSKLFLLLDPKGLAGTNLRYTVPDPSFRVRLDCRK